jgi:hypothetical protein
MNKIDEEYKLKHEINSILFFGIKQVIKIITKGRKKSTFNKYVVSINTINIS